MSENRKKRIRPLTEEEKRQWYVRAVTNTQAWFDKATELLALAEIVEQRIREAWADARKNVVSDVGLGTEDIVKRIEEEKKSDRWPLQSQGLYFVLVAFAIENLCKGDIIRTKAHEVSEKILKEGKLPEELKKHHLIEFVKAVGLDPDKHDQALLRNLEKNAVWAARYPVPVRAYGKISLNQYQGVVYMKAASPEEYIDHVKALVSKLCEKIRANAI